MLEIIHIIIAKNKNYIKVISTFQNLDCMQNVNKQIGSKYNFLSNTNNL